MESTYIALIISGMGDQPTLASTSAGNIMLVQGGRDREWFHARQRQYNIVRAFIELEEQDFKRVDDVPYEMRKLVSPDGLYTVHRSAEVFRYPGFIILTNTTTMMQRVIWEQCLYAPRHTGSVVCNIETGNHPYDSLVFNECAYNNKLVDWNMQPLGEG
jgi:hypothetical protein